MVAMKEDSEIKILRNLQRSTFAEKKFAEKYKMIRRTVSSNYKKITN